VKILQTKNYLKNPITRLMPVITPSGRESLQIHLLPSGEKCGYVDGGSRLNVGDDKIGVKVTTVRESSGASEHLFGENWEIYGNSKSTNRDPKPRKYNTLQDARVLGSKVTVLE
jgi:hypothetical protein